MDNIRTWLNGPRDYATGAKLYLMHGENAALRRCFSEPASDWKKKKLAEVLTEMLTKKTAVVKKVAVTKEKAIERVSVADKKWPEQMDATVAALREKWKPLFAEMMNLMARIYDVAKLGDIDPAMKREAGQMAHRICDLDDMCDAIYEQRDYYLQHGKLPEEKKPMELVNDPIKMPVALENARRYVRQYRNKLKKNPADVYAAEKLKLYEWAVEEYKRLLKLD